MGKVGFDSRIPQVSGASQRLNKGQQQSSVGHDPSTRQQLSGGSSHTTRASQIPQQSRRNLPPPYDPQQRKASQATRERQHSQTQIMKPKLSESHKMPASAVRGGQSQQPQGENKSEQYSISTVTQSNKSQSYVPQVIPSGDRDRSAGSSGENKTEARGNSSSPSMAPR